MRMPLKRAAVHCFPDTPKGRNRALRLFVGSKKHGLHVRQMKWKGMACVAQRRRKRRK